MPSRKLVSSLVCAVAAAACLAGGALGDGDPASDVLYAQNVFVPYPSPPAPAVAALKRATAGAYTRGYRVKVAVIASRIDLGSVPNLFDKPDQYAKFLGTEIGFVYVGPLLIVMPAGFGIYDGGRSTAAERRVLARLHPSGSSPEELTRTAALAVERLTSAGALRSKDILAPVLYAVPSTGHRGAPAQLKFQLSDDSGRSRETVRVSSRTGKLLADIKTPLRPTDPVRLARVTWHVPQKTALGTMHFCVDAVDPSGNKSATSCASLKIA